MAEFKLEKQIDSCLVTKKLLEELENYLMNKLPEITGIPQESIQKSYKLSISDNLGTEVMSSISDYSMSMFLDSTGRISLEFGSYTPKTSRMSIVFDKEKMSSRISITYESNNPREIVSAIREGITRVIEPYKNRNRIFHPHFFVDYTLLLLTIFVPIFIIKSFMTAHHFAGLILISVLLSLVSYWFGKMLKPYISFESNRYLKLKKWSDWFIFGLLTFIIFGTLFVLLRKKLLGF